MWHSTEPNLTGKCARITCDDRLRNGAPSTGPETDCLMADHYCRNNYSVICERDAGRGTLQTLDTIVRLTKSILKDAGKETLQKLDILVRLTKSILNDAGRETLQTLDIIVRLTKSI